MPREPTGFHQDDISLEEFPDDGYDYSKHIAGPDTLPVECKILNSLIEDYAERIKDPVFTGELECAFSDMDEEEKDLAKRLFEDGLSDVGSDGENEEAVTCMVKAILPTGDAAKDLVTSIMWNDLKDRNLISLATYDTCQVASGNACGVNTSGLECGYNSDADSLQGRSSLEAQNDEVNRSPCYISSDDQMCNEPPRYGEQREGSKLTASNLKTLFHDRVCERSEDEEPDSDKMMASPDWEDLRDILQMLNADSDIERDFGPEEVEPNTDQMRAFSQDLASMLHKKVSRHDEIYQKSLVQTRAFLQTLAVQSDSEDEEMVPKDNEWRFDREALAPHHSTQRVRAPAQKTKSTVVNSNMFVF